MWRSDYALPLKESTTPSTDDPHSDSDVDEDTIDGAEEYVLTAKELSIIIVALSELRRAQNRGSIVFRPVGIDGRAAIGRQEVVDIENGMQQLLDQYELDRMGNDDD